MSEPDHDWWRTAVFYQVYIRSFADGDGDGVGDLPGLRSRLPYLKALGVDGLWITPFYPSPMADHGYDVADPRGVDPRFGALSDLDGLVADAHRFGLRVTIDLVPNHVSDRHPWFQAALGAPDSPQRQLFHFRAGTGADGSDPPNNWPSVFGGPAWTRVADGQWYLHLFAAEQPDLNWAHPEVIADLDTTMRFWLDRGVDGFRIDVGHGMAKPPGLPDMADPTQGGLLANAGAGDPRFDDDGVHEIHRGIRRTLEDYPGRMAVGELWVRDDERLARYIRPDELHLAFNFRLLEADWEPGQLRAAVEHSLHAVAGTGSPPCWVLSNHDRERHVTRYGDGARGHRRARAAALLQLGLPGVAYLYNGDELGLPNVDLPDAALQDPVWERSGRTERGRDGERVPLPWGGTRPPYEFSTGRSTWLPMPADWAGLTVQAQLADPDSMLCLYRRGLELRRDHPALSGSGLTWYDGPPGTLAFTRPGGLRFLLNASDRAVPLPAGEVLVSSGPLDGRLPQDTAVWLSDTGSKDLGAERIV
ncbi:glycoside hydrolase family 13 protein [soil metagenome]